MSEKPKNAVDGPVILEVNMKRRILEEATDIEPQVVKPNHPTATQTAETSNGLRYEPLPITDLDNGIIGWTSQEDPAMPFNFSKRRKWTWVWLLSAITLLTPFATSILSPAINTLDADFHNNDATLGSMTVSIYLFGYVVGPVFIGPLSEVYGRKIVLSASNIFFCLWQIWTLGGSIIGDMFRVDERGFAMGMWNLGPLFGPVVGPLIGGFLTQYIGWRWDFWIILIAATPVKLLIAFCTTETCHKVLIEQETIALCKDLGRDDFVSCYNTSGHQSTLQNLRVSLLRPLKLIIFSPIVFFLSLYIAFIFGVVYLFYTTISTVFSDIYGWNTGETGFPYIALGAGNVLAWLLFTIFSDKIVIKLTQANSGIFTPEMRLVMAIPFGIVLPVTLFWYGWSAHYNVQWASTIFSLVPFGFGIVGLFLPISTYIVDSYPIYAASATSANVMLRSLVGALLPLAGPPLYDSLGLGWGTTLLGLIAVIMVPLPFIFYTFGTQLRASECFQL